MRSLLQSMLAATTVLLAAASHAHPGGLDGNGCHTNRKTGDYHCHRGAAAPATLHPPPAPAGAQPRQGRPANARPFANCAEARAAGAAPVHRGDPGYGPHLDRDNDGIGCEPYRGIPKL